MIEYVLPFSRTGLGSIAHVGRKDASLGQLMAAWGTALSQDGHHLPHCRWSRTSQLSGPAYGTSWRRPANAWKPKRIAGLVDGTVRPHAAGTPHEPKARAAAP
jgi:hypothetical protein